MGKKKREHVVFDQMLKPKKSIPFSMINREVSQKQKRMIAERTRWKAWYKQNVKQGANDWANLNKRVTAIEQQLGMRKAMEESIESVVDKVLNEMINNK